MTQHDAKTAVKRIKRKLMQIVEERELHIMLVDLRDVLEDVTDLERQLETRKPAKPNCRPVTAAELSALCSASNVITFQPAA